MASVRRSQTTHHLGSVLRLFIVGAVAASVALVHNPAPTSDDEVTAAAYSTVRRPISAGFSPSDLVWADQTEINNTLDFMKSVGSKWIRVPIAWSLIEPVQGTRNWSKSDAIIAAARARGISVLGVIHSTPGWAATGGQTHSGMPKSPAQFGQFSADVATRYQGKVAALEIWNEPNGAASFTPMDAAKYTDLLKAAYPRIKAVSSSITVIGGAVGAVVDSWMTVDPVTFVKGMYAAGAKGNFDALSFHPYHYQTEFSQGLDQLNSPIEQLMAIRRSMLANADGAKKVWATEYGEPTSAVSEAKQSSMIADFTRSWASLPYTGPVMIHTVRDRQTGSSDPEATFGLLRTDWSAKPAAYQFWGDMVNGVEISPETQRFEALTDPALGAVVGPVFKVNATTYGQKREKGVMYDPPPASSTPPTLAPGTTYSSPAPVAAKAAQLNTKAIGPFANGYQDFDQQYGLRIFYSQATGVHAIGGGIVASWKPALGLATSDEVPLAFGTKVTFEHGSITWYPFFPADVVVN